MNGMALFAGAGGGILGEYLAGWRTVCAVEIDAYAASILIARQNDGILPPFPIWDDVRTFDGKPWRGIVDVVSGGFPCQDISCAGRGGVLAENKYYFDDLLSIDAYSADMDLIQLEFERCWIVCLYDKWKRIICQWPIYYMPTAELVQEEVVKHLKSIGRNVF